MVKGTGPLKQKQTKLLKEANVASYIRFDNLQITLTCISSCTLSIITVPVTGTPLQQEQGLSDIKQADTLATTRSADTGLQGT